MAYMDGLENDLCIPSYLGATMQHSQEIIGTHPQPGGLDVQALADCINACFDCAATCTACADACLAEDMVADLRHCIRTNLDCASVCNATGQVLSRQTETGTDLLRSQLQACITACNACGDECEKHAQMHGHCRVCAAACRHCEQSCTQILQLLS